MDPMGGGFANSPHSAPGAWESRDKALDPSPCYFVEVCGFTFEFWSTAQIRAALVFFQQKVHPSSQVAKNWGEHDLTQRWYERLPLELQKNGKRERVIAALEEAIRTFS